MDALVVGDVVAVVAQRRGVEGQEPERVDAEPLQVVELLGQAGKVADAVVVAVEEGADVHLVDDRVLVPERCDQGAQCSSMSSWLCNCTSLDSNSTLKQLPAAPSRRRGPRVGVCRVEAEDGDRAALELVALAGRAAGAAAGAGRRCRAASPSVRRPRSLAARTAIGSSPALSIRTAACRRRSRSPRSFTSSIASPFSRTPRLRTSGELHASSVISRPDGSSHAMSFTPAPRIRRPWKNFRRRSTGCFAADLDQAA